MHIVDFDFIHMLTRARSATTIPDSASTDRSPSPPAQLAAEIGVAGDHAGHQKENEARGQPVTMTGTQDLEADNPLASPLSLENGRTTVPEPPTSPN